MVGEIANQPAKQAFNKLDNVKNNNESRVFSNKNSYDKALKALVKVLGLSPDQVVQGVDDALKSSNANGGVLNFNFNLKQSGTLKQLKPLEGSVLAFLQKNDQIQNIQINGSLSDKGLYSLLSIKEFSVDIKDKEKPVILSMEEIANPETVKDADKKAVLDIFLKGKFLSKVKNHNPGSDVKFNIPKAEDLKETAEADKSREETGEAEKAEGKKGKKAKEKSLFQLNISSSGSYLSDFMEIYSEYMNDLIEIMFVKSDEEIAEEEAAKKKMEKEDLKEALQEKAVKKKQLKEYMTAKVQENINKLKMYINTYSTQTNNGLEGEAGKTQEAIMQIVTSEIPAVVKESIMNSENLMGQMQDMLGELNTDILNSDKLSGLDQKLASLVEKLLEKQDGKQEVDLINPFNMQKSDAVEI